MLFASISVLYVHDIFRALPLPCSTKNLEHLLHFLKMCSLSFLNDETRGTLPGAPPFFIVDSPHCGQPLLASHAASYYAKGMAS